MKWMAHSSLLNSSGQELRDLCYEIVFDHWEAIKAIVDTYKSPLNNRDEDVWFPVLVMAEFFKGVVGVVSVVNYARINIKTTLDESIEYDKTYHILKELLSMVNDTERDYSPTELKFMLQNKIDFGDKKPENIIGLRLFKLQLEQDIT